MKRLLISKKKLIANQHEVIIVIFELLFLMIINIGL